MTLHRRLTDLFLLGVLCAIPAGCSSLGWEFRSPITKTQKEPRFGPGKLSAPEVQSEIMSFTDTFNAAIAEQWNRVAADARTVTASPDSASPEEIERASRLQRACIENKLATVSGALSIASSPNPTVALADMITMVTLQRMVLEEPAAAERYGEEARDQLLATFRAQEEKIWRVGSRAIRPALQEELKELIAEWRAQNPDATYVANVRLEDFAKARQQTIVTKASGDSLLSLVALDPLAGLDPTQREVQRSRMLGERMFFYATRSPQILKWQVESLYQDMLRAPELKSALATSEKVTDAVAGISSVAKELPEKVAIERSAALEQFFSNVTEARSAAIKDIGHELSAQREALIADLETAQDKVSGTLHEYGDAVEKTQSAAATLTTTVQAVDSFAARFDKDPNAPAEPEDPNHNPFADYSAAVAQTGDAADRVTRLAQNLDQLLDSDALATTTATVHAAVEDVQASSKEVIDYAFLRLLILAVVTPFAFVLAALLYYRVTRRHEARTMRAIRKPELVRPEHTFGA